MSSTVSTVTIQELPKAKDIQTVSDLLAAYQQIGTTVPDDITIVLRKRTAKHGPKKFFDVKIVGCRKRPSKCEKCHLTEWEIKRDMEHNCPLDCSEWDFCVGAEEKLHSEEVDNVKKTLDEKKSEKKAEATQIQVSKRQKLEESLLQIPSLKVAEKELGSDTVNSKLNSSYKLEAETNDFKPNPGRKPKEDPHMKEFYEKLTLSQASSALPLPLKKIYDVNEICSMLGTREDPSKLSHPELKLRIEREKLVVLELKKSIDDCQFLERSALKQYPVELLVQMEQETIEQLNRIQAAATGKMSPEKKVGIFTQRRDDRAIMKRCREREKELGSNESNQRQIKRQKLAESEDIPRIRRRALVRTDSVNLIDLNDDHDDLYFDLDRSSNDY